MVRASVLDAALQLGFGGPNSTVANWIFNNPLDEEEEPEDVSASMHCFIGCERHSRITFYSDTDT
jgi:hypothetical protein